MRVHAKLGYLGVVALLAAIATPASAQSFRVQCPNSTITHPVAANNSAEPSYAGPTAYAKGANGYVTLPQISMARSSASRYRAATATRRWPTAPRHSCSRLARCPGSRTSRRARPTARSAQTPVPNSRTCSTRSTRARCFRATRRPPTVAPTGRPTPRAAHLNFNGAIGLAYDVPYINSIYDINEFAGGTTVTVVLNAPSPFNVGDPVVISGTGGVPPAGYDGTWAVSAINIPMTATGGNQFFPATLRSSSSRAPRACPTSTSPPRRRRPACRADGRPCRPASDHGRRRDEREHPGAADGHRRGRRVLPDADQRRHDHAAGPL